MNTNRKIQFSDRIVYDQTTNEALQKIRDDLFPEASRPEIIQRLLRESLEKLGYLKPNR